MQIPTAVAIQLLVEDVIVEAGVEDDVVEGTGRVCSQVEDCASKPVPDGALELASLQAELPSRLYAMLP
jgi:hypothetical protein